MQKTMAGSALLTQLDMKNATLPSALAEGIRYVCIGQRGSKSLPPVLISEILQELKTMGSPDARTGAFFAGIFLKGADAHEMLLEQAYAKGILTDAAKLTDAICPDAPAFIREQGARLLNGETLDIGTAKQLGQFLFSGMPGDSARGLIASVLRIRYETLDEYEGLLLAMNETLEPSFRTSPHAGRPIIQISEPLTGVKYTAFLTPLLAASLQKKYRTITLVGSNPGPKMTYNLEELAMKIGAKFISSNTEIAAHDTKFGYFVRHQELSKPLGAWVPLRRQIVKRPFLSILEKFINPAQAKILITSCFHAPYGQKMIEIAQRAGFPGVIVLQNGIEGTLAFPLLRPAKLLCSAKQADGTYVRIALEIPPEAISEVKEENENPSLPENIRLIRTFKAQGKTDNKAFDARVRVTCSGIQAALDWIETNCTGLSSQVNKT